MEGGPSQMETLDPKPGHTNGGPTKSIKTAVSGIEIADNLNGDGLGESLRREGRGAARGDHEAASGDGAAALVDRRADRVVCAPTEGPARGDG